MRRRLRNAKITIAVLTPYRAQKDLVSDEMSNVSTGDKVDGDPQERGITKVLTINESQGIYIHTQILLEHNTSYAYIHTYIHTKSP